MIKDQNEKNNTVTNNQTFKSETALQTCSCVGRWKKYLHSVNKKKLKEQVILHEQGLEQFYNASKTEKYCLKPDWQSTFVL